MNWTESPLLIERLGSPHFKESLPNLPSPSTGTEGLAKELGDVPLIPKKGKPTWWRKHKNKFFVALGVTAGCALLAPLAVVGAVGALGFGAEGIVAGSVAAAMMSAEAVAAGGAIAAGGTVATLQSIGAAGLGVAGTAAAMGGGAAVGAAVGATGAAVAGAVEDAKDKRLEKKATEEEILQFSRSEMFSDED